MTDDKERELVELTVELTATKLDLKYVTALQAMENKMYAYISRKFSELEQRRRWGIETIISIGALAVALWAALGR